MDYYIRLDEAKRLSDLSFRRATYVFWVNKKSHVVGCQVKIALSGCSVPSDKIVSTLVCLIILQFC